MESSGAEKTEGLRPRRQGDGGLFLVVADNTDEFPVALRYAARLAESKRGHLGILYVIDLQEFSHWGGVENRIRQELRTEAENFIWEVARRVHELNGMYSALFIEEGDKFETLIDVINRDESVKMLVLAGTTSASNPGPLVAHFSSKGLARLQVPVVVVPSHLDPQRIDALA